MNGLYKGIKFIFGKIKQIRYIKLIPIIPVELQDKFHRHQLITSVYRLKMLCVVIFVARIFHVLMRFPFSSGESLLDFFREHLHNPFYIISFVLLFFLAVTYFSKKNKSNIVWFLCHLFVIVNMILSVSLMLYFSENITLIFFWFIILFMLVPNFKPNVFIPLAVIYFIATIAILIGKNQVKSFTIGTLESLTIEHFIAIIVIKILLYNNEVKTFVNTSRINALNEELQGLSITDELTKLNNRRSFLEYMDLIWKQTHRLNLSVTVLMIDVDYFKKYNDSLGHLEGDKALIAVAQCLKNNVKRETDFVARFGGEEFVCLLPFLEKDEALEFSRALVQSIEEMKIPHPMSEVSKYVTISVGMASTIPNDNNTQAQLLQKADEALYKAKETGRNRVVMD